MTHLCVLRTCYRGVESNLPSQAKCQNLDTPVHDANKNWTRINFTGENRGLVARAVSKLERVCTQSVRIAMVARGISVLGDK